MAALVGWENFYVIVGSSAGALIGLQFVVITLIADMPVAREAGHAFATPTIVDFATVLLLSAVLRRIVSTLPVHKSSESLSKGLGKGTSRSEVVPVEAFQARF